MSELITALTNRRNQARIKLEEIEREIKVIDQMLFEIGPSAGKEPQIKITKKSVNSIFYKNKIKELLQNHDLGMSTRELHTLIGVFSKPAPNYNTFRSYLNRMKEQKIIVQDKNKKWHLKIKPPVAVAADGLIGG